MRMDAANGGALMKLISGVILCLVLAAAGTAEAGLYTLADLNSTATYDTSLGMTGWTVDGVSQLYLQSFYYSIGGGDVENLADLPLTFSRSADVNPNPGDEVLSLRYAGGGLQADLGYTLAGSGDGSRQSDIGETISVQNVSGQTMVFHFYQYVDLDLGGTDDNDTVSILNQRFAFQSDPVSTNSETIVVGAPSHYQAGNFIDVLNSVEGGTLTDDAGAYTGDAAWAFQWDVTLAPGGQFGVNIDKAISPMPSAPEPATLLLVALGGLAMLRRRA
jgi:hypothetical protein